MVVGYLLGTFDMLNVADLDVLAQARGRCSRLVVGVHTDDAVLRTSGMEPVVPLDERVALLRRVRGVDEVLVHERTALPGDVTVLLAVRAEQDLPEAEVLAPRRVTSSGVLRRALEPDAAEDVA